MYVNSTSALKLLAFGRDVKAPVGDIAVVLPDQAQGKCAG